MLSAPSSPLSESAWVPSVYPDTMDKKEIESPKLTENFLVWIGAFMLLIFLLLAHFVWRVF